MVFINKLFIFYLLTIYWKCASGVVNNKHNRYTNIALNKNYYPPRDINIHKVSFTQKGYIQFLRYIADVPPLDDYTFCIWVRSNNLTYSHPLLSYSIAEQLIEKIKKYPILYDLNHENYKNVRKKDKVWDEIGTALNQNVNDRERLIRVWISPGGTNINLEILEYHIFKIPIKFIENHWYHVCQSWSSHQAVWNLYLNGKLKSTGFEPKLEHVTIPGGGDIVVGQEYTDFNKGLDDGIEGDVFGFNFILAPTTLRHQKFPNRRNFYDHRSSWASEPADDVPDAPDVPDVPDVLRYFSIDPPPNRQPKGFFDFDFLNIFKEKPPRVKIRAQHRLVNDLDDNFDNNHNNKALGSKLVELGYKCWVGKGAPIVGKDVLISWTKTPVRVFGGAILTIIKPFCL